MSACHAYTMLRGTHHAHAHVEPCPRVLFGTRAPLHEIQIMCSVLFETRRGTSVPSSERFNQRCHIQVIESVSHRHCTSLTPQAHHLRPHTHGAYCNILHGWRSQYVYHFCDRSQTSSGHISINKRGALKNSADMERAPGARSIAA